jgi:PEP-CTERM motif-containing protein
MLRSLFACAVVAMSFCSDARAALVEITYTGSIYNVANNPPVSIDGLGLFGAAGADLGGKAVSVAFTFDVTGPALVGPQNNYLNGTVQGVEITVNGITRTIAGSANSLILNYNDGQSHTHVQHEAYDPGNQYVTASLTDNITGAFPLSLTSPYSFSGPNGTGFFRFQNDNGVTLALFTPTHVEAVVAPVPEPSTWAMMLIGFAGVGYLAYRRNRRGNDATVAAAA